MPCRVSTASGLTPGQSTMPLDIKKIQFHSQNDPSSLLKSCSSTTNMEAAMAGVADSCCPRSQALTNANHAAAANTGSISTIGFITPSGFGATGQASNGVGNRRIASQVEAGILDPSSRATPSCSVSSNTNGVSNGKPSTAEYQEDSDPENDYPVPEFTVQICKDLALDIVFVGSTKQSKKNDTNSGWLFKVSGNSFKKGYSKRVDKYAKTMRRTVAEISERHEILFSSMVNKLNITRDNHQQIFIGVVEDIFNDGQINWGRVVTVYALGTKIAQFLAEHNLEDCLEPLVHTVGDYVAASLGKWIHENGDWDAFCVFFPENRELEGKIWNGLWMTAVGLAGAAGLATLFAMKT